MKRAASPSKPRPQTVGIRIDVETKSGTDIKHGVYRYTEDPDFEMLIIKFAPVRRYPGGTERFGAPKSVDLRNPDPQFIKALTTKSFQKHAFNANFERVTLGRWLGLPPGQYLNPEGWYCSAVRANTAGVFGSLDEVARAVGSPIAKDPEGKRLIKFFSIPMSTRDQKAADRSCGCQRFHSPSKHPADFGRYENYCAQDVMTEAMVASVLPAPSATVQHEYEFDQRINDRGIRHFAGLSRAAVTQVEIEKNFLMEELKILTGLENPNSVQQFRGWLDEQDYPMASLAKAKREEALADPLIPDLVRDALELKGSASLSSVTKHKAALDTRCADGRIRGSLRFYGAHTGREAGRGIQPQNLPTYEASARDRALLLKGLAGPEAPRIAKGSVRASLVPARDHLFVVVDENAIEARVLGHLAGEQWVEDEFKIGDGKIYEATAEAMFGVNKKQLMADLAKCGKCGTCQACALRSRGKVSDLALGYAGGAGALVTMGAEAAGMDIGNYNTLHDEWEALGKPGKFHEWQSDLHDYPELIYYRDLYRTNRPMTVRFWKLCAKAWDVAATTGNTAKFGNHNLLTMVRDGKHNRMILPSGRSIWYRYAQSHLETMRSGDTRVDRRTFTGKSKGVGHMKTDTHGGKLTENVTQAVARDVLFDVMAKIEAFGPKYPGRIVLHVHDEVVLEVHKKHADQVLADTLGLMSISPDWAPDLPVKGAGGIMERYGK